MRSLILACLFAVGVAAQVKFVPPPLPSLQTFTETPEGNWRTIIRTPNGNEVYEYEPGTKFTPTVRTELTLLDAKEGLVRYTYHISNDANSVQQISHARIGPGVPIGMNITRGPYQWFRFSHPGWVILDESEMSTGIQPGKTDFIEIEAQMLPGIAEMKLVGNIEYPGSVPDGLTEKQYLELRQITLAHEDLTVPVIAPKVGYASGLPRERLRVILAQATAEFQVELLKQQHPHRRELVDSFERNRTTKDFRGELAQLRAIIKKKVDDPWHQTIADALDIYVEVLTAGLR